MQAADVTHTMDAWDLYLYWNQRLFDEMQLAYRMGRSLKDPAVDWHDGELAFLDGYVIPLATKLKDCGALEVASDECLNCALQNRREWQIQGRQVVQRYVKEFEKTIVAERR